jgi:hypothetical protein
LKTIVWRGAAGHPAITAGILAVTCVTAPLWVTAAAAVATGAYWVVREAQQRHSDFPGISRVNAFKLNWVGPAAWFPEWIRRASDDNRSPWDWRLQAYAPAAVGAAFVLGRVLVEAAR